MSSKPLPRSGPVSGGGRLKRNVLNLTLPTGTFSNPDTVTPLPSENATHTTTTNTVTSNTTTVGLSSSSLTPTLSQPVTTKIPSAGIQPPAVVYRRMPPPPLPLHNEINSNDVVPFSRGGGAFGGNRTSAGQRFSSRMSTGPVDVDVVYRQLKTQDLDDAQRRSLFAFIAEKQKIGELRPEDFERLNELGKGNGGVVTRVRHTVTGLIMAKKSIHLEIKPIVRTQIIRELQVLHDCNSPYIVGYYGAFCADGDICLCMEYMDGGSLDLLLRHAGRIPEPIVAKILHAVLKGLLYLRCALRTIHRDVKPSNILVRRNGEVKLCDFGVSGQLNDSLANSFVGTRSYMAPERLTGEQYNILSDVWSVGLSLVELTTGRYPIPAVENDQPYLNAFSPDRQANLSEHLNAAINGRPLPPVTRPESGPMAIFELLSYIVDQPPPRLPTFCFSDSFIDLVESCLRRPPGDRPSLESLLRHPFVTTVAGACPDGVNVQRQSTMYDANGTPKINPVGQSADPINIGNYLSAVLPPDEVTPSASSG